MNTFIQAIDAVKLYLLMGVSLWAIALIFLFGMNLAGA